MNRFFLPFILSIILSSLLPVLADSSSDALDLGTWNLQTLQGATGSLSTATDGPNGAPSLVVQTSTSGSGELWLVQLQYPISLVTGKKYHLKFFIKSEPDHYVSLGVTQRQAPYAKLCDGKSLALTSTWQEINYDFALKASESEARILLTNLNVSESKFYVANVTLTSE